MTSGTGDATVYAADGAAISLRALLEGSGGRPVLLAFVKTTCPTCQLAWPYLAKLHDVWGGDGVRVVGVSQDGPVETREFHARHGGTGFDLVLDREPSFAASNAYGVEAVPHFALVDPGGRVRRTWAGWQRKEMEALARELAHRAGVPERPVIAADDPVPSWKAG